MSGSLRWIPIFHLKWKCFAFVKTENLVTRPLCLVVCHSIKERSFEQRRRDHQLAGGISLMKTLKLFLWLNTLTLYDGKPPTWYHEFLFLANQNKRYFVMCTYVPWLATNVVFWLAPTFFERLPVAIMTRKSNRMM